MLWRIAVPSVFALAATTAMGAVVNLTNGAPGAGHLDIDVDDYGSYGEAFAFAGAGNDDQFEPTGSTRENPTFSSGWMTFTAPAAGGDTADLLSAMANWQTIVGGGTAGTRTLNLVLDSPNALVGSNECNSAFHLEEAAGGPVRLNFTLNQFIGPAVSGVTFFRQTINVTNAGTEKVALVLYRPWDLDLLWDTRFGSDVCGAGGGLTYVFQHEPGNTAQGFALSGTPAFSFYYAAKQGHDPPGGPPQMGYGTDVQAWNARGIPATWRNLVAYLGYNLDGTSGTNTGDAHIALEWRATLAPGQSLRVVAQQAYGQISPVTQEVVVLPTSFSFFRGVLIAGNLASLHAPDDNRLVARPGVVLSQAERPIQLIIEGTSPTATPTLLKIVVEAHCDIVNINQMVHEFNFTTNAYTLLDSRNIPTTDLRLELTVPDPAQHVRASDRLLRARISYKEAGFSFSYPWSARVDEATWRVTQ